MCKFAADPITVFFGFDEVGSLPRAARFVRAEDFLI